MQEISTCHKTKILCDAGSTPVRTAKPYGGEVVCVKWLTAENQHPPWSDWTTLTGNSTLRLLPGDLLIAR